MLAILVVLNVTSNFTDCSIEKVKAVSSKPASVNHDVFTPSSFE